MKLINNMSKSIFFVLFIIANNYQVMANNIDLSTRQNWNFIAYLDDKKIGFHNFEVISNDGKIIVKTEAKFDVSFMYIPLYSYEHKNKEVWRNDCLISLDSSTLDDGEELFVQLSNTSGNTQIITPDKNISNTSCIKSFAYWDYENINSKTLLNAQTGELIDVSRTFVGYEKINVNNQSMNARQYLLKGKDSSGKSINIHLWYNSNNQWLALESKLDNGRSLRYQLQQETML